MSNVVDNANTSENYDAQQTVEEIREGDRKAPTANVEADYEASKQFSTSPIDKTEEGANAAEAATSSQFELPEPDALVASLDSVGNPDDYKQMAQDTNSLSGDTPSASTDALYQKALEKGTPGN